MLSNLPNISGFLMGAVGAVGAYIAYVAITKGSSAAWSMLKSWWTSGETALAAVKADVAKIEADVAAIKAKVGL